MKEVIKKWGKEEWIVNEPEYCGKKLTVEHGHNCSIHFHVKKKETFYILEGILALKIWDLSTGNCLETQYLGPGASITLKPLTPHLFASGTDKACVFMEFSSHHEDSDSYRFSQSQ